MPERRVPPRLACQGLPGVRQGLPLRAALSQERCSAPACGGRRNSPSPVYPGRIEKPQSHATGLSIHPCPSFRRDFHYPNDIRPVVSHGTAKSRTSSCRCRYGETCAVPPPYPLKKKRVRDIVPGGFGWQPNA